jgi:hypothetical protein
LMIALFMDFLPQACMQWHRPQAGLRTLPILRNSGHTRSALLCGSSQGPITIAATDARSRIARAP